MGLQPSKNNSISDDMLWHNWHMLDDRRKACYIAMDIRIITEKAASDSAKFAPHFSDQRDTRQWRYGRTDKLGC